jgi:hypothetical protein
MKFDTFAQYLHWMDSAVDDALAGNAVSKLEVAALQFRNAYSLPGYNRATQATWFAKKLADTRFARSGSIHEFGLDFDEDAEILDDVTREVLSTAYLAALAHIEDEVDLVVAFRFVVQHQPAEKSLAIIETELLKLATDQRLREFVYDALRMYSLRQDLSLEQITRVQELARSHFS